MAALILGVFDVAGKYYVPEVGAFVIYALMVVLLILFPLAWCGGKHERLHRNRSQTVAKAAMTPVKLRAAAERPLEAAGDRLLAAAGGRLLPSPVTWC
jgi:hypothetical protein